MRWTVVLEKTLESPLDCKEIQPVHSKGDQSWIFTARTHAEAETPILWPPVVKNWFIWKDPDARNDSRWEEKGTTEDEMVGWHHQLDEHGFGWTPGVGDGQGGPACCSSWGCKELDMTEWLKWIEIYIFLNFYNVVLVSAIQQCKSAIIIHMPPPSLVSFPFPSHPFRSSQSARLGSLCYTATSHHVSILHLMLLSPFAPLSLSTTVSPSPFSISGPN